MGGIDGVGGGHTSTTGGVGGAPAGTTSVLSQTPPGELNPVKTKYEIQRVTKRTLPWRSVTSVPFVPLWGNFGRSAHDGGKYKWC